MPFLSSCIIVEYHIEAISPGSGEHGSTGMPLEKLCKISFWSVKFCFSAYSSSYKSINLLAASRNANKRLPNLLQLAHPL
jgi:hypothetical protein